MKVLPRVTEGWGGPLSCLPWNFCRSLPPVTGSTYERDFYGRVEEQGAALPDPGL